MNRTYRLQQLPKLLIALVVSLVIVSCQNKEFEQKVEIPTGSYVFYILSDAGAQGAPAQHRIAHLMDSMALLYPPQMIVSNGDLFHGSGISTLADTSLVQKNITEVYNLPHLQVDWYGVLGNHEYYGAPDTAIALGRSFAPWKTQQRYYSREITLSGGKKILMVFTDTAPYKKSYLKKKQMKEIPLFSTERETYWLDTLLSHSKADQKIVFGHHPLYTSDWNHGNTYELIEQWMPIFKRTGVKAYFSGHVHNFEDLRRDNIAFIRTSTSGAKTRKPTPWFGTRFNDQSRGFTICVAHGDQLTFYFVGESGKIIYRSQL